MLPFALEEERIVIVTRSADVLSLDIWRDGLGDCRGVGYARP